MKLTAKKVRIDGRIDGFSTLYSRLMELYYLTVAGLCNNSPLILSPVDDQNLFAIVCVCVCVFM